MWSDILTSEPCHAREPDLLHSNEQIQPKSYLLGTDPKDWELVMLVCLLNTSMVEENIVVIMSLYNVSPLSRNGLYLLSEIAIKQMSAPLK